MFNDRANEQSFDENEPSLIFCWTLVPITKRLDQTEDNKIWKFLLFQICRIIFSTRQVFINCRKISSPELRAYMYFMIIILVLCFRFHDLIFSGFQTSFEDQSYNSTMSISKLKLMGKCMGKPTFDIWFVI